jgi:hypothetical protein
VGLHDRTDRNGHPAERADQRSRERQHSTTLAWSEDDTVALPYKLTLPGNALKPSRHLPDFSRAGGSAKVSPRPAEMRAE